LIARRWPPALAVVLWATSPALADTITLTNGRVIEAERAWVEGNQVRYQKDGGTYGVPRSLVQKLDQRATPPPAADPDVQRARALLAAADPAEAVRAATPALERDPNSIPALQVMAEARLALGDAFAAKQNMERALKVDNRNARAWELLGDAYAGLGDKASAEAYWRRSNLLRPDPQVQRKAGLPPTSATPESTRAPAVVPGPASAAPASSTGLPEAQFRLRYDGGVNEPLGKEVLSVLTQAYAEYQTRLGFHPDEAVTVVLQMTTGVSDRRAPEWADGWNDGSIRVPTQGTERLNARHIRVLRHELAHSFVTARTGANCPTWLQEGIAQWLEGGDPAREDAVLAPAARARKLQSLLTLEGPFRGLSEAEANVVYGQSLAAVTHILRLRGEPGLVRLVLALGDRLPSEEALPVALGLSYPEFQRSFEEYLKTADRPKPAAPLATR
jgi:hypothetical protein